MGFDYEKATIRHQLKRAVEIRTGKERVDDAVVYALETPGKLFRPLTTICVAQAYGLDPKDSVAAAVPVELGNAASLILDDIHDRTATRRGRASCWKEYGPAVAQMAAIKLILHAQNAAANATSNLSLNNRIRQTINEAAFLAINGQVDDILCNMEIPVGRAIEIAERKTGALFSAAGVVGGLIARAPEEHLGKLDSFGRYMGVAFQIKDDIYDINGDSNKGGKPVGADVGKPNIARITGINEATKLKEFYISEAKGVFTGSGIKTESLESLLDYMFSESK